MPWFRRHVAPPPVDTYSPGIDQLLARVRDLEARMSGVEVPGSRPFGAPAPDSAAGSPPPPPAGSAIDLAALQAELARLDELTAGMTASAGVVVDQSEQRFGLVDVRISALAQRIEAAHDGIAEVRIRLGRLEEHIGEVAQQATLNSERLEQAILDLRDQVDNAPPPAPVVVTTSTPAPAVDTTSLATVTSLEEVRGSQVRIANELARISFDLRAELSRLAGIVVATAASVRNDSAHPDGTGA